MKANQFINPQEAAQKVDVVYRIFLILWVAIFASLAFLLALALLTPTSGRPNQTLTFILLSIGFVIVIGAMFVKRNLIKRAIEKQQVALLQTAYIFGFALCESAALFGLLDHFTTGSRYSYLGFGIAAIGMLLMFPKKDHVRATM